MDGQAATISQTGDEAAAVPPSDDETLVSEELLVEEVSIDGMCGVY